MPDKELRRLVYETHEASKWMKSSLEKIEKFIESCDGKYASKSIEVRVNTFLWGLAGFIGLGMVGFFFLPKAAAYVSHLITAV